MKFRLRATLATMFLLFFPFSGCATGELSVVTDQGAWLDQARNYVNRNMIPIGSSMAVPGFDPTGVRLFMVGEEHEIAANRELQFGLVKYLVEKGNVRRLVFEDNAIYMAMIDWYLQNGDEIFLKRLFAEDFIIVNNDENYQFWRKLRALNASLDVGQRFHVSGYELDGNPLISHGDLDLLVKLFPDDSVRIPIPIEKFIANLRKANNEKLSLWESDAWFTNVHEFLLMCRSYFEYYLGAWFVPFRDAVFAAWDLREAYQTKMGAPEFESVPLVTRPYWLRDPVLLDRVKVMLTNGENVLVWRGKMHTCLNFELEKSQKKGVGKYLREYIDADPWFAGKFKTFTIIYDNCLSYYYYRDDQKPELFSDDTFPLLGILRDAARENFSLLWLKGAGSPFTALSDSFKRPLAEYSDWLIFIRNSGEMHPPVFVVGQ